jgi:tetratricopeptide (TPR) repeat protein
LVQELCENFAFKPPLTETQPQVIPPQFDLQHDQFATQLAADSIARPLEVTRVLGLLKDSAAHRLLLEGASGSGKTVLLAQIFQAEIEHAVFISMDAKLAPLEEPQETNASEATLPKAEKPKASLALRVGMYCLSVLNQVMGLPQPNQVLPLPKVQDAIRDNLADFANKQPNRYFVVVLDGLNQASDPGGVLGALPTEVLRNFYILVSSQPQERVRLPLNIYTQRVWTLADISTLAQAEAEALVWHDWTATLAEQPTPQRTDLPATLLRQLCQASHNLPVFLTEWTKNLRALWAANPQDFATQALAHFQQYHTTALPAFLRSRLDEVKHDFNPPRLLEALLWCLSLIPKAVTLQTLADAIQALRQQGLLTDLPAVSTLEIEEALRQRIGGFVQRRKMGLVAGWQLSHEILGQWFCEQHGQVADLASLRLSLVPFGAIALPPQASEKEIQQWREWVRHKDEDQPLDELYDSLLSEQQIGVLDSLLAGLPEQTSEYAQVLTRLVRRFLYGTGEQARAFALQSKLERTLQRSHLPMRIQADVLIGLGDIQRDLNQLDTAKQYFERALQFREQLLSESATPQNRRGVGIALNRLGALYVEQNQLETAKQYFERSLQLSEQLLSESATPQNRRGVGIALNRLGALYVEQNQLETAKQYFERDLQLSEQLLSESATLQNRRDVSLTLERIGDVYVSQNDLSKAQEYFERTLTLREQLLSESATPQNRREVAVTLNRLGALYVEQNQLDTAKQYFERSLQLSEQLLSESATPQNRRELAVTLNRLGALYVEQNQLDTAKQYFERALQFREQLLSESATPQNRRDVGIALNRLGDLYVEQNQLETAKQYFERSLQFREQLLSESATPQNRRELAVTINRLGDLYVEQNQLETAKQYFERSLQFREQLLSESATPQNRRDVSLTLERIGDVYVSKNDLSKAQEYFERTLTLREQLLSESATPQNRREVAVTLNRLGALYVEQNQLETAKQYFERALQLSEQLLSESATPQNRRDVAYALNRLGDLYVSQNQLETAKQYFERDLQFREQLLSESATPQNRRDVGIALNRLGDLYVEQNQLETAKQYFERSLQFREQLLSESATPQNRRDVAVALAKIGDAYRNNQPDKALEYYKRSQSFFEQLLEESPIPKAVNDM